MSGFWQSLPRPFTVLAPMEDVTDTVFRRIVSRHGKPDVFFTEFVNVDGMCSPGREAVAHRLRFTEEERPIIAQVWGLKPENYARAADDIRAMGFDGIDINMGCPVKKIVKSGACSALIENPSLAREIIIATREGAGPLPVSVKTRMGFSRKKTEEWSGFLLELEPAALTMHGRIAKDMSDIPADWNEIGKVVSLRDAMGARTVVIGNGDVDSLQRVKQHHEQWRVDGVMIGRGVFHNLFVFRSGEASSEYADLSIAQKLTFLKKHLVLQQETWGELHNFNVMKKFVKVYVASFGGAAHLRAALMEATDYEEMYSIIDRTLSEKPDTLD